MKTMDNYLQPEEGKDQITRQTLSEQIYERLKEEIITHRIGFGEKLVNRDLQKRFQVSSTPIRDAINHLYLDGLLDSITNGGARVVAFDLKIALEINYVIQTLTRGALQLIQDAGTLSALARRLAPLIEDQAQITNPNEYVLLDQSFHQTFFNFCGNRHLRQLYDQYSVLFEMLVRMTISDMANTPSRLIEHQRIYERCLAEDAEGLKEELDMHYKRAAEWFTAHSNTFESQIHVDE